MHYIFFLVMFPKAENCQKKSLKKESSGKSGKAERPVGWKKRSITAETTDGRNPYRLVQKL